MNTSRNEQEFWIDLGCSPAQLPRAVLMLLYGAAVPTERQSLEALATTRFSQGLTIFVANTNFQLRKATQADIPALHELIAASVRGLMTSTYSPSQLEAALGTWLGVDSQLVADGTYFIVETEVTEHGTVLVGCGGWSRRKTPYGSDHRPGRENGLLNPSTDAAKIRAFFVHPDWARKGIGSMIMDECERAAMEAGFTRFEMGATLSGVALYEKFGYVAGEKVQLPLTNGESLPILKMAKTVTK